MKPAIVGVVALVIGLGIGFGISMPKINALRGELETARKIASSLEAQAETTRTALEEYEGDIARLRDELEKAQATPAPEPAMTEAEPPSPSVDASELFSQLAQALGEDERGGPGPRDGRYGGRFGDGRGHEESEEDEAAREERRRAYMDEFRQRMSDFLTQRIEASNNPAEKQRIASIGEYAQSLMEQRRLLRDAETEEERQAIFDTMQQNADVLRSMVEEQQDQVMRDSLERQGITSKSEQDSMIAAYKEAQQDPFYRGPFSFFGGGYGGYGMRGRGGPPGGGPPGGGDR